MALIVVAADKGAPGVTTASVALAAVWPRPVLLAECDPAGGDLVYRLPAADGGRLDPRRGLLSLAVAARRGLQPHQVWEHAQKLRGGLDILAGVSGAEQGAGLELLWGSVGRILAAVPQADVIADCGRVGVDGPVYDLLAQASAVILLTRVSLGEVIRLRDRVSVLATALQRRGRPPGRIDVVVITDYKNFGAAIAEVGEALRQGGAPARVAGGLAYEPKSADQLRGEWSGKLDKSMFIRTARAIAGDLASALPGPSSGTRRAAPVSSPASGPAARPASGRGTGAPSDPAARPGSGSAARPVSGRAPTSASAAGRSPDGRTAAAASVFQSAPASSFQSAPASSGPVSSGPVSSGPVSDPVSSGPVSSAPVWSAAGKPDAGKPPSEKPADGKPADGKPTAAQSQGPGPSRSSYLDGLDRPGREPPRDPAAADQDRAPRPMRPASSLSVRLGARGRHAGTPAADGQDQRSPERDGAQQTEAHPPWPEPETGTPQSRPKGR
jgi:hypothetical protein